MPLLHLMTVICVYLMAWECLQHTPHTGGAAGRMPACLAAAGNNTHNDQGTDAQSVFSSKIS